MALLESFQSPPALEMERLWMFSVTLAPERLGVGDKWSSGTMMSGHLTPFSSVLLLLLWQHLQHANCQGIVPIFIFSMSRVKDVM